MSTAAIKDAPENKTLENLNILLKEWARISKTHGFDRLVISRTLLLKLVWLISLLVSICLCSFLISKSVAEYFQYEVKTKLREVYADTVPFPSVTICNANIFVTPEAKQFIRDHFKNKFNISISNYADLYEKINMNGSKIPSDEISYLMYTTYNPNFNESLKKSFGYPFYIYCSYIGSECKMGEDVVWYYDLPYGNCFKFNPRNYENGSRREIYNSYIQEVGLFFMMFTGVSDYDNDSNYLYEPSTKG
jgi:hypothetical protein